MNGKKQQLKLKIYIFHVTQSHMYCGIYACCEFTSCMTILMSEEQS